MYTYVTFGRRLARTPLQQRYAYMLEFASYSHDLTISILVGPSREAASA
jgi:hypothetical protein